MHFQSLQAKYHLIEEGDTMEKVKAVFVTIFGTLFSWLGILAIPLMLLLGLNLTDYITGIAAAPYRNEEDERPVKSYKSIRGIYKKICMYLLILIGWIVDVMLRTTLAHAGFTFVWKDIFATVIACWLIFNEIISLLENIDDIGAPIPPFLLPIMKIIRKQITISIGEENADENVE